MQKRKKTSIHATTTKISIPDARDHSSVRTTFKFRKEDLESFDELLDYYNAKPKALLDDLLLGNALEKILEWVKGDSKEIIDQHYSKTAKDTEYIRKTMVLSKPALNNLNRVAQKNGISRDNLLRLAIVFLKIATDQSIEERKLNTLQALNIIRDLSSHAEECKDQLQAYLESNDPTLEAMDSILIEIMNLEIALEKSRMTGKPIDLL